MRKTGKPYVITIHGNNNKVSIGGNNTLPRAIVVLAIAIVVLAISLCCPDSLAEVVRWIFSTAINS